ncbi:MAG: alpha/beta hydrolase [Caldilineaceae bacterium]|nr:alpha/beta hydrolase [Caldilineaceae bacterium]
MKHQQTNRLFIYAVVQTVGRMTLLIMAFLSGCLVILVGLLLAWSPGKPKPFIDKNGKPLAGSIAEKTYVDINGVAQGIFIKSKDAGNPVLLYLHGGMPDYFLTQGYPTHLEDDFTVVWWEQRGAGISFHSDLPSETITQEQLIADTLAMTNYLRQRFGQEKIYLMGHSGGTFFGIQAAAQAPALYHAYIGVAQMVNTRKSEKLAYDYMLQAFKANGNTTMVRRLEAAPVTLAGGTPPAYLALRDGAMHSLGIGTTHAMKSVVTGIFFPSLTFREYTLLDKVNLWRAKARNGVSVLWEESLATDLSQTLPTLDLPVYFFEGTYDYTCNYSVAKEYFERLDAPVKGFYTFAQSAHSPIFEEPDKAQNILRKDVLTGTNRLADTK